MPNFDVAYHPARSALEGLLESIDRPGEYCTHGRLFAPLPRLEVAGAGLIAFPVLPAQADALVAVAERAPYGRGPDTVLDRSVRDCWQIDADQVEVGGGAWSDTLAQIVGRAAEGLGCPRERTEARLYKLLVYEPGGFFSAHRDSEKATGMVATLVISLPVAGTGGEMVVRHQQNETVIDLRTEDPSELAFAAFYADCVHETRPVATGHRIVLVYELLVRDGAGAGELTERAGRRVALRLLFRLGDQSITLRFLREVTTAIYSGGLNAELATVVTPAALRDWLPEFIRANLPHRTDGVIDLVRRLVEASGRGPGRQPRSTPAG